MRSGPSRARYDSGMTLVELLMVLTVSSLVMLIIGGLYLSVLNLTRRGRALWELTDVSIAMETLTRELQMASRYAEGIVIWAQETDGVRHDTVGVLSTRIRAESDEPDAESSTVGERQQTGWIYFVHDLERRELRRIEQAGRAPGIPLAGDQQITSPTPEGLILARNVRSFSVVREGTLVMVTLVAAKDGQTVRLQTEIWPRNQ